MTYEPSLSYALLSRYNILKDVFANSGNITVAVSQLQAKLTSATETKHRVDIDLIQSDTETISDLVKSATKLSTLLNSTLIMMKSTTTLSTHFQVADILSIGASVLQADSVTVTSLLNERHENYLTDIGMDSLKTEIQQWQLAQTLEELQVLLGPGGLKLAADLQRCLDLGLTTINDMIMDFICRDALKGVKENRGVIDLVNTLNSESTAIVTADPQTAYSLSVAKLTSDTGVDWSSEPDHLACLNDLATFSDIMDEYKRLHNSIADLPPMTSISDVQAEIVNISTITNDIIFMNKMDLINENMLDACNWIFSQSASDAWKQYGNDAEIEKKHTFMMNLVGAGEHLTKVNELYGVLNTTMLSANLKYSKTLYILDKYASEYEKNMITMSQLATYWDTINIEAKLLALTEDLDQFATTEDEIHSELGSVIKSLTDKYASLWDLSIPLYNYTTFFQSKIWTDVILESNDSLIITERQRIANREYWPPSLDIIFTQLFEGYINYLKDISNQAGDLIQTYESSVLNMKAVLTTFKQDITISDDLFL